ncbi:MAG: hypothetical protein ACFB03_18200 [Paracoccaceae bacterium]
MSSEIKSLSQELQDLVREGYKIFRIGAPPDLSVCTEGCCMPAEAERRALEAGQANITRNDLREWQDAAFSAENGRASVRWVLPRTLELLAAGEDLNPIDYALTLRRLAMTGFPDAYRPAEVDLMSRFATALIAALANDPNGFRDDAMLDDCLCMIAGIGLNLEPVLVRLDACPVAGIVRGLAQDGHLQEVGFTAFWDAGPALDLAVGWYVSRRIEDRMIAFWDDDANPSELRAAAAMIADDIALRCSQDRRTD